MQYDLEFLTQLYHQKNLNKYARITALTLDELPIETVEGKITQGSISVDGRSTVRRTCSLTMVTHSFQSEWALDTKFK